ncbi:MAG TPA: hypothetical protein VKZ18_12255 [Polyangia bacterium]|nr:hypothetical protein [Polyangia bacterium]
MSAQRGRGPKLGDRRHAWLPAVGVLLVLCALPAAALARTPRISVEVAAPGEERASPQELARLREALIARLDEEGFEVVAAGGSPDVALGLMFRGGGWFIRATSAGETLEREAACGIRLADDRLEVVQKATELARKAQLRAANAEAPPAAEAVRAPAAPATSAPAAAAPTAAAPSAAAPSAEPSVPIVRQRDAGPPPPPPASESPRGPRELSAGIDALVRGPNLDALARLGGRLALEPRIGLRLDLGLTYSDQEFRLFEEQALVGVGYRLALRFDASVELAAMGGLLLHEYRLEGGSGWSTASDALAEAVVIAGRRISDGARLELRAAAGWRTGNVHPIDYTPYWSAEQLRVEVGVGVSFFR